MARIIVTVICWVLFSVTPVMIIGLILGFILVELLSRPVKCDGNHRAPECKDLGCWHRCQECGRYWIDGVCCEEGKI